MAEPMVFAHSVEALFQHALGDKLTPKARARLRMRGLDLERPKPSYGWAEFHEWVRIAAQEVHPELAIDGALEQVGMTVLEGFEKTLLGKAVVALGKVFGPKRTLGRMTENFRSTNNYVETRLTELGNNSYDLWINDVGGVPAYYRGIMKAVMTLAGVKNVAVEERPEPGSAAYTFRISWL